LVGSWETLPRQNSTYLLFCTRKYCNFATTNLLCARGRIKTSQKMVRRNLTPQEDHHRRRLVPLVSPLSAVRRACVLGRTPLESARAYASMPPDEAETEGAWVWTRWRAGRGLIGRLACAYWSAPPPPTSLATVPRGQRRRRRRVCGGVSLRSGRRTERDKKSKKNVFALYGRLPVIQTQQPTKNTRTRRRR
jgi:hypothetical protein